MTVTEFIEHKDRDINVHLEDQEGRHMLGHIDFLKSYYENTSWLSAEVLDYQISKDGKKIKMKVIR